MCTSFCAHICTSFTTLCIQYPCKFAAFIIYVTQPKTDQTNLASSIVNREPYCRSGSWSAWSEKTGKPPQALRLPPKKPPRAISDTGDPSTNKQDSVWTNNKQTKLSDKGGDLGSTPRREFYLFPYFLWFHVCERKLQRLEWCDFKS